MLFHDFFFPFVGSFAHSLANNRRTAEGDDGMQKSFYWCLLTNLSQVFALKNFLSSIFPQFFFFFVSEELEGFSLSMFLFPLPCWSSLSKHKFGKVCSPLPKPHSPSPPILHRSGLKSLWIICIKKSKAFCMNFRLMHKFSSWLDCCCFLFFCCGATAQHWSLTANCQP